MATFLLGGGWDEATTRSHYARFLAAAGTDPVVACLVVDEGEGADYFQRFAAVLRAAGRCDPIPVLVPVGGRFGLTSVLDADALLVCGGLTPAYATALAPVAAELRAWLAVGRPHAGFSAGAAVAAQRALVGGWLQDNRPVCPADAAEDLASVTVVAGLGLVPFILDVHCAQWGTLSRLVSAVRQTGVPGVGLDENTLLSDTVDGWTVSGAGHAWVVSPAEGRGALAVQQVAAGAALRL